MYMSDPSYRELQNYQKMLMDRINDAYSHKLMVKEECSHCRSHEKLRTRPACYAEERTTTPSFPLIAGLFSSDTESTPSKTGFRPHPSSV